MNAVMHCYLTVARLCLRWGVHVGQHKSIVLWCLHNLQWWNKLPTPLRNIVQPGRIVFDLLTVYTRDCLGLRFGAMPDAIRTALFLLVCLTRQHQLPVPHLILFSAVSTSSSFSEHQQSSSSFDLPFSLTDNHAFISQSLLEDQLDVLAVTKCWHQCSNDIPILQATPPGNHPGTVHDHPTLMVTQPATVI